jgi:transcriptional antiterminator RfaH
MMSAAEWYVLHCKPQKENQVYAYLEAQSFEVFYPTIRVQPVNPRSSKVRPYFPRYMFVHTDLNEVGMSALNWIPNAIGLVRFDQNAVPVPDNVIYELRRQISKINAAGGLTCDHLKQGDRVRIVRGPLAGYEAIFDLRLSDKERVQVLLNMLGRLVKVQISANVIERKGWWSEAS